GRVRFDSRFTCCRAGPAQFEIRFALRPAEQIDSTLDLPSVSKGQLNSTLISLAAGGPHSIWVAFYPALMERAQSVSRLASANARGFPSPRSKRFPEFNRLEFPKIGTAEGLVERSAQKRI